MAGMARPLHDIAPGRARSSDGLVAVGPGRPDVRLLDARAESPAGARQPDGARPRLVAGTPLMSDPTAGELDVFGFPVQLGKVQPPPLPAETLERERLLEWMAAKIHSRLVLILADAGYGKTTLLADWSRRTRLRVLWYRLDETDRDWVVFVNHVVAAGREIDPGFAPNTISRTSGTSSTTW